MESRAFSVGIGHLAKLLMINSEILRGIRHRSISIQKQYFSLKNQAQAIRRLCVEDFCLYSSLLLLCFCSWRNLWKTAIYSEPVTQMTVCCCYQEIHLISAELVWQTLVRFLCFMSELQETSLQKQSILSIPLVANRLLLFVSYPKPSILGSLSWAAQLTFLSPVC